MRTPWNASSRRDEITAGELIAAVSARYYIRDLTVEEPENVVPPPVPQACKNSSHVRSPMLRHFCVLECL